MKEIEEMAELLGQDNLISRKELLRLEQGMTTFSDAERLLGRVLKRETGIDPKKMGSYGYPDYGVLGSGEVFFARDCESGEKRIALSPTLANITAMGQTGMGKSNLLKLFGYQFITLGIAQVKVIDFLSNFSGLARCCKDTVALDVPSINIMHNDGVPQQRWINALLDQVAFHTDTMIGGRSFLNRINSELAQNFHGTPERYCMADLCDFMRWMLAKRKLNISDRGYCERVVGKPESWDAESDGAFACQRGVLEFLDPFNQIISLRGLSEELQRFYVSVLIARDFMRRLFNPELCRKPLIYIVDEAKHVFSRKDERPGLKSAILSMLTQTGNVNMFWFLATQEPSQLAHTCLANSPTKIILGISEGFDLNVIQQSLRINADRVREISRFGESGLAAIKFSKRFTEPFVAKIELFEERSHGTGDFAGANMRLAQDAEESVLPRSRLLQRHLFSRDREQEAKYGKISGSAKRLLEAYGREPYKCLTDLYGSSGLGTKGTKAKKELAMAGFIGERDILVKSRRGPGKYLLNITEKGRFWLREAEIRPVITGKGGPKELYYSVAIEKWAVLKGFRVHREYKGADLTIAAKDGKKVAVEIACRKDNQVNNVKRDLESGLFQKIVIACETERILKDVRNEYGASGLDRAGCEVIFLVVTQIMP